MIEISSKLFQKSAKSIFDSLESDSVIKNVAIIIILNTQNYMHVFTFKHSSFKNKTIFISLVWLLGNSEVVPIF